MSPKHDILLEQHGARHFTQKKNYRPRNASCYDRTFSTMWCCGLLTTSFMENPSSIFIFCPALWLRQTLGKVCLRPPNTICAESKLVRPRTPLYMYVQSSAIKLTCLYTMLSHSTRPCLYQKPRSLNATLYPQHHLVSQSTWLTCLDIILSHRASSAITSHLVMSSKNGPICFIILGHHEHPSIWVLSRH